MPIKLYITPLGGLGEVGMNMLLLELKNEIHIIDCGITFPSKLDLQSANFIIPNFDYVIQNRHKVKSVMLTHAHEDHIGALGFLLKSVPVPVYALPFVADMIRSKLSSNKLAKDTLIFECSPNEYQQIGSISFKYFPVCHSIASSCGIVIETPLGRIIHSGDFRFDSKPAIGEPYQVENLIESSGGVNPYLFMCDSTNSLEKGKNLSDIELYRSLLRLLSQAKGRVILATFSSQVYRQSTVSKIAKKLNKKVAYLGKNMQTVNRLALRHNYLNEYEHLYVKDKDISSIPNNKLIVMCTGSQGEGNSMLQSIAEKKNSYLKAQKSDTFIISASTIPGNEIDVSILLDKIAKFGAKIITNRDDLVHISGHAKREDLLDLLQKMKPQHYMPIHGETRMLVANRDIALSSGIKSDKSYVLENGKSLQLSGSKGKIVDLKIDVTPSYLISNQMIRKNSKLAKQRKKLAKYGLLIVTLAIVEDYLHGLSFENLACFAEEEMAIVVKSYKNPLQEYLENILNKYIKLEMIEKQVCSWLERAIREDYGFEPKVKVVIIT